MDQPPESAYAAQQIIMIKMTNKINENNNSINNISKNISAIIKIPKHAIITLLCNFNSLRTESR